MDLLKLFQNLFDPGRSDDPKSNYSPSPGPQEILESGLPESKFKGRKVAWNLTVQTIQQEEIFQDVILVLAADAKSTPNIWLAVNTKQYPVIYSCASGRKISVKGEIATVKGSEITLQNCQLGFPG